MEDLNFENNFAFSVYGEGDLEYSYELMDSLVANNNAIRVLEQRIASGDNNPSTNEMKNDLYNHRFNLIDEIGGLLVAASEEATRDKCLCTSQSVVVAYFDFLYKQYEGKEEDIQDNVLGRYALAALLRLQSMMKCVPIVTDIDYRPRGGVIVSQPNVRIYESEDDEDPYWPEDLSTVKLQGSIKLDYFDRSKIVRFGLDSLDQMRIGSRSINRYIEEVASDKEIVDPQLYLKNVLPIANFYKPHVIDDPVLNGEIDLTPVISL